MTLCVEIGKVCLMFILIRLVRTKNRGLLLKLSEIFIIHRRELCGCGV